jgi:hypothetical protein
MARAKPIQISKFARYEGVELEVGIVRSHANDDPGTLPGVILQGGARAISTSRPPVRNQTCRRARPAEARGVIGLEARELTLALDARGRSRWFCSHGVLSLDGKGKLTYQSDKVCEGMDEYSGTASIAEGRKRPRLGPGPS